MGRRDFIELGLGAFPIIGADQRIGEINTVVIGCVLVGEDFLEGRDRLCRAIGANLALAKAAKKIQAIARGFLVRVRALKAPLLVELEDIDTRKLEELERMEAQKKVEKEAFLAEMEQESILLKQALMEAKTLIKKLKAEKTHYEDENASLKQECKDFKKANKKLSKEGKKDSELNVDAAMMQARVSNLERQTTSREDLVEQCLQNISKRQEQIRDAERQCELEKLQTQRLKVCISNVLDLVEPKSERLTEKLLKIAMKNSVFL